jgi:hypothetical protein
MVRSPKDAEKYYILIVLLWGAQLTMRPSNFVFLMPTPFKLVASIL